MTIQPANALNSELLELFRDSTLGLYLDEHDSDVFALGTIQNLKPGEAMMRAEPGTLHVLLDGRLATLDREWWGPGNHFDSDDLPMMNMDAPSIVWSLNLQDSTLNSEQNQALRRYITQSLVACDAAEAEATAPKVLPDPETLCDVDHPEIRRLAARLRRATPASTAEAIMLYVWEFPYRFGNWQEKASETLARKSGMCTTKANLQVALMRAAGLEAGYVEVPMETQFLGELMPSAWLKMQREAVKHYFAAVKLDDKWHAVDSSYDWGACSVYARMHSWLMPRATPSLSYDQPYSLAIEVQGKDLFDITVQDNLVEEMGKKSRFRPRHFEALNVRMDRIRRDMRKTNTEKPPATIEELEAQA